MYGPWRAEKYLLSIQTKKESKTKRENRELTDRIRKIHTESKQRYGAPKIRHMPYA
ncbi:IS3 family transposase [Heyndrickxia coagulans]|uniref:IS3 family transposase n=1 Tax=Heyndrickxia coagulans TaxID=1398 RepID=UPI003462C298